MTDIYTRTGDWLQMQCLMDWELSALLAAFGQRLLDGGVPVARIQLGRLLMHPVLGIINTTWNADTGHVSWFTFPRAQLTDAFFDNSPFGDLTRAAAERFADGTFDAMRHGQLGVESFDHIQADLTDPGVAETYSDFREMADEGFTGYMAFLAPFGEKWHQLESGMRTPLGSSVSFATKRRRGFSQADLDGFRKLLLPLMACMRVTSERFLAQVLMETYLGRQSGKAVLEGQIARGHTRSIDCVLIYSDMRNSTALSQALSAEDFTATVNDFFECTAGAVIDHGGEVLKFIGDGVLAIFPIEGTARPAAAMTAAALASAQEAFARAADLNEKRSAESRPAIEFGIGLHVGRVIYGNVGTATRLDFTATGAAVALVSRCEALTRELGRPLVATGDFAQACAETADPLGRHRIRGFEAEVPLYSYADGLAPDA